MSDPGIVRVDISTELENTVTVTQQVTTVEIADQPSMEVVVSTVGMQGPPGPTGPASTVPGPTGPTGLAGATGPGVAAGGATGDILVKLSGTNYDTGWTDSPTVDALTFDTTAAETLTGVGTTAWDDTHGSPAVVLKGGNVVAVVGQTVYERITNDTGSTLVKGQAVYLKGASGQKVTVGLARADSEATSSRTLGVVAESIAHNQQGFVITQGLLQGFNTSALTEGQIVWLSPTTAGGLTTTKPQAPHHSVVVGMTVKQGAGTSGSVFVRVQNGVELDEVHDVKLTDLATGDLLTRTAAGLWENIGRDELAADLVALERYTHTQTAASTVWDVTHNLGRHPIVAVSDTAGTEVVGDTVHLSPNETRLVFQVPFAGTAEFI